MDPEPVLTKIKALRDLPPPGGRVAIRKAAGVTQEDFAASLKVRRETISRWETGRRTPRGRLLVDYSRLLSELREGF